MSEKLSPQEFLERCDYNLIAAFEKGYTYKDLDKTSPLFNQNIAKLERLYSNFMAEFNLVFLKIDQIFLELEKDAKTFKD